MRTTPFLVDDNKNRNKMELFNTLACISVYVLYFGMWTATCNGITDTTDESMATGTDMFYTEIVTEMYTEFNEEDLSTTEESYTVTSNNKGSMPSIPTKPTNRRTSKPKDPKDVDGSGDDDEDDDDDYPNNVSNHRLRDGFAGLWIAIAALCGLAAIVILLMLGTIVLRWRRNEESSYSLDRDNDHTNPAYESGEIAGLEPAKGMQEVRIGLTTFADEESKSVL